MDRLKALRLARDAAAGPAATTSSGAASRPKRTAKTAKGKTKAGAGGTLAEWLADRQKDGHQ